MGKPKDPEYWKKWRAAHPEYRERERLRLRARERTPEQRREERQRARPVVVDHSKKVAYTRQWRKDHREAFLAQQRRGNQRAYERHAERLRLQKSESTKRAVARRYQRLAERAVDFIRPDTRDAYHDPLYEDAIATALLSLWENRNRRNHVYSEEDWVADARKAAMAAVMDERRHRWYGVCELDPERV